jgi:hypothetical protein
MRRLVAAIVMVAVAVSLAACGGGGSTTTTPTTPASTQSAPPPPGQSSAPVSTTNKLSPSEPGTGVPFPTTGAAVPREITVRAQKHQPMLIFFYDPVQPSTKDVRTEIDSALKAYRGLIDLVAFDVAGALPNPVTGSSPTSESAQVSLLTQSLKIGFTPYMIFVDKNAVVTGRFRGYLDRKMIEREIIRATQ